MPKAKWEFDPLSPFSGVSFSESGTIILIDLLDAIWKDVLHGSRRCKAHIVRVAILQ